MLIGWKTYAHRNKKDFAKKKDRFLHRFSHVVYREKIRSFVGRMGLLCFEIRTFAKIKIKKIKMKKVINTNQAPAAIGPYSQAVQAGNLLFVSGQLGLDPSTGEFVEGGVKAQAQQLFKNMRAILAEAGYTMADIVKTTVFLADMSDFAVVNEVYAAQFEGDYPARSAVAVKTLPKNGLVEVEVIAAK